MPQNKKVDILRTIPNRISDAPLVTLVGYHLKRAFNVFQHDLNDALKPFDLRMVTFSALALIDENSGLSQSQLADKLDIERPNLVTIVDALEERGLIRRERVPGDRRIHALEITDEGRRLFERAQVAVYAHEHRLLEEFDPKQIADLIKILKRIESKNSHK